MFTSEELNIIAAGLEQLDDHHTSLGKSVPALVASGAIEETRGQCLLLLAKVRRAKVAAERAAATAKEAVE